MLCAVFQLIEKKLFLNFFYQKYSCASRLQAQFLKAHYVHYNPKNHSQASSDFSDYIKLRTKIFLFLFFLAKPHSKKITNLELWTASRLLPRHGEQFKSIIFPVLLCLYQLQLCSQPPGSTYCVQISIYPISQMSLTLQTLLLFSVPSLLLSKVIALLSFYLFIYFQNTSVRACYMQSANFLLTSNPAKVTNSSFHGWLDMNLYCYT